MFGRDRLGFWHGPRGQSRGLALAGAKDGDDDHSVGYKRPPRQTRFKPGKSGNPAGRPKRDPTLEDDMVLELAQTINVRDGGHHRVVSKQRAIVKAVVAAAVAGDLRAASLIIDLTVRGPKGGAEYPDNALVPDSGDDIALESFLAREVARRVAEGEMPPTEEK
jgi:hypothetical protein